MKLAPLLAMLALAVSAFGAAADDAGTATGQTPGYDELRNPYFGQTHQHTGWSFDAATYNVPQGPENSFRHARGERVKHPNGEWVQLKVPLDFHAVTDHAEYLGVLRSMFDPKSPLSKHPMARLVVGSGDDLEKSTKAFYGLVAETIQPDGTTKPDPTLNTPELKRSNWDEYLRITDRFNEPGKFTTLPGFEWSSQPGYSNLHRNVLFRSSERLPVPFSYFDSKDPEDLWAWMDEQRRGGVELLAIPHNGNLSNGAMYSLKDSDGKPRAGHLVEGPGLRPEAPRVLLPPGARDPDAPMVDLRCQGPRDRSPEALSRQYPGMRLDEPDLVPAELREPPWTSRPPRVGRQTVQNPAVRSMHQKVARMPMA